MSDRTDYRAEYGHQPTWDEQRRKQDDAAERFYERITATCPKCDTTLQKLDTSLVCMNCNYEEEL